MATYCEDYPCCGHTDGLGCGWTYTPEAQAFDRAHVFCEHEAGFCEVEDYDHDDYCCENAADYGDTDDMDPRDHNGTCDNYDGADIYQWETTEGVGWEPDVRGEHDPTL